MSSTFCSGVSTAQAIYTASQLSDTMPNGILTTIDYASANSSRDPNTGLLSDTYLSTAVQTLYSSGFIPTAPMVSNTQDYNSYLQNDNTFVTNVKSEYCFYESRYFFSINSLVSTLETGFTSSDPAVQAQIGTALQTAQTLNMKLNDFIQIVNAVTKARLQKAENYNESVANMNQTLSERAQLILSQQQVLNSSQATATLYKQMVNYTHQKNSANSNLLTLYSFLNIFALGMLFYVYRST